jgi:SAM-dependent methyltransferase
MSAFAYASDELDAMAEARRYYASIMQYFEPHLGKRVMEVGAGVGTFSAQLRTVSSVEYLRLVEPATNNVAPLRERFSGDAAVEVLPGYLSDHVIPESVDTVVAVNVLEHVEDDVAFLKLAYSSLIPGGRLLLFVPALQAIFGSLDRVFQHHRRYDKMLLRQRMRDAGFDVLELRYSNLVGVLAWFVAGRILKRTSIGARDVRLYDRLVVPWLSRIERRVAPPIGQSLIAIASK